MELESAIEVIQQWNSTAVRKDYVFDGYRHEIDQYLQALDRIQASVNQSPPPLPSNDQIHRAKSAIQIAMARLADEFRNMLILNTAKSSLFADPGSNTWSDTLSDTTSYVFPIEEEDYARRTSMSSEVINDLRSVAKRMKSAGVLQECIQVYTNVRKSIVNSSFAKLKVPEVNPGVNSGRLEGEDLESKIKEWMRAGTICVKILFTYEKRLSAQIFDGIEAGIADLCFLETVNYPVMRLLKFAEAVSSVSPSHEKLFIVLELYKVFLELSPKLNDLFDSESLEGVRIRADDLLVKLGEMVSGNLVEYEESVLRGQFMIQPAQSVNSLPVYVNKVMITERKLCNYKDVFGHELNASTQTHQLSVHLIRITENLVVNLEGKSKLYDDSSVRYAFLRNNISFIVQQIEQNTRLKELIGPEYLNKLTSKLHQVKADHLNLISERMIYCLRDEGLGVCWVCFYMVSKSELRERITTFDGLFAEVLQTLGNPVEANHSNRDDQLLRSLLQELIPAYKSFLEKFRSYIVSENLRIKYNSAEELQDAISGMAPQRLPARTGVRMCSDQLGDDSSEGFYKDIYPAERPTHDTLNGPVLESPKSELPNHCPIECLRSSHHDVCWMPVPVCR